MKLTEHLLYQAAKRLYETNIAHSDATRAAVADPEHWKAYRQSEVQTIRTAADRMGARIEDQIVLDLGCGDGYIAEGLIEAGAKAVMGVDLNAPLIEAARQRCAGRANIGFRHSGTTSIPAEDDAFDLVVCFDVFEHVSKPHEMLAECKRVLRPGGEMLIGAWGWHHPFAPHMWDTIPVPWAHVFFSEKTLFKAARRVYDSPWYRPTQWDLDADGRKKAWSQGEGFDRDWLNMLLIRDFEAVFEASGFDWEMELEGFGSRFARWTHPFLRSRWLREYVTSFFWARLQNPT